MTAVAVCAWAAHHGQAPAVPRPPAGAPDAAMPRRPIPYRRRAAGAPESASSSAPPL
jgi:hypothetical protein